MPPFLSSNIEFDTIINLLTNENVETGHTFSIGFGRFRRRCCCRCFRCFRCLCCLRCLRCLSHRGYSKLSNGVGYPCVVFLNVIEQCSCSEILCLESFGRTHVSIPFRTFNVDLVTVRCIRNKLVMNFSSPCELEIVNARCVVQFFKSTFG